jgi:RNA polymerase sigma factor (sigma-70 family)
VSGDFTAMYSDEEDLIHSLLSGDDMAFSMIYSRYAEILFAYGCGFGFERELIKDAIQDVFYKLYFNRNLLKDVKNLRYYLYRMLKNRLLDINRSVVAFDDIQSDELTFDIKADILDNMIAEEEKKEIEHKIEALFCVLTSRQREAIYLRYIREMEYEEIGKLLDMTAPAVRKLVARAIKRLREINNNGYLLFCLFSYLFYENFQLNGNI